jgi:D-cysteine desulfhydrase
VNALVDRWPNTARIPRLMLAALPTPVAAMPHVSAKLDADVWVKRDDLTAARYGGNKVRKLEYILAEAKARGADTLITMGALGSHHVFATALYGREHGFETHAVLLPEPYRPQVEEHIRADLGVGAKLYTAESYPQVAKRMLSLAIKLRLRGHRPFIIPAGGSTVHGALGFVSAGVELATQVDAGLCPDPDGVYVACGSTATAAGLALGLAAAGLRTRVIAVRVADKLLAHPLRVAHLIRGAEALLRSVEPRFPSVAERAIASVEYDHVEIGRGYGRPTPSSEAARVLAGEDGLTLDVTYTSKALACLLRHAESSRRGQRLVFWNTMSNEPMAPFLERAPPVPEELVRLMTLPA